MNVEIYARDGEQGNIYLINADNSNEVTIIDPGVFNADVLNMIESKNRVVKHVLITHSHPHCRKGLETLLKVYRADVYYSGNLLTEDVLSPTGIVNLSGCDVTVLPIERNGETDLIFKINRSLFVGDILSAGKISEFRDSENNDIIHRKLYDAFASLQGFFYVFPGHGPPSTLDIERTNIGTGPGSEDILDL